MMSSDSEFNAELYDDIAPGYYDQVFKKGSGVQWFWHFHRFAAVVENLPATGERILDVGCGPGTFLGTYAGGYAHGHGVELARPQVDYARSTYGSNRLTFEASDAGAFSADQQFDAIVSIEVIEHLPAKETAEFLAKLHRSLKPGGTLVLTTPNYRSFWPVIEWAISKKGPVDYLVQHINHFTVPRLKRELEAAGFNVVRHRTFFVIAPFVAGVSRRLAEWIYAAERVLLPAFGSEIVIAARKPS